ncbi:MAG: hypothetical protein ACFKPT_23485 [Gloeotrichia echinulata GP01]
MACVADFDPQNKTGDCTSAPLSDQGLGTGDWGLGKELFRD